MGANTFSLIDPATKLVVETYKLPPSWQGTGQVIHPPGKDMTWQCFFLHKKTGCVGFRNYSVSYSGIGPYLSSPVLQNNNLAAGLLNDLSNFLQIEKAQIESSALESNDTPENRQIMQMMSRQVTPMIQANCAPLLYHAAVSMVCGGKPYEADLAVNLLCWEYMAGMFITHGITVQNSYGVAAPASLIPQARKAVLNIMATRRENPQWVQFCSQYAAMRNKMSSGHNDRMRQIIKEKDDYIDNIRREVNRSTSASMDRVRQGWHEVITEKKDIVNPYRPSTTVQTDNNYHYAWTNRYGEVINTDSVLFNPNEYRDLNDTEWTRIK
ncbi:MAG: hypothetical protein Q4F00_05480 [bacterium]|nr:hypothetical protein [bacterium]